MLKISETLKSNATLIHSTFRRAELYRAAYRFFDCSFSTNNCLALVDLYDHDRGGHFGHWLVWFAIEFSSRFNVACKIAIDKFSTNCANIV